MANPEQSLPTHAYWYRDVRPIRSASGATPYLAGEWQYVEQDAYGNVVVNGILAEALDVSKEPINNWADYHFPKGWAAGMAEKWDERTIMISAISAHGFMWEGVYNSHRIDREPKPLL